MTRITSYNMLAGGYNMLARGHTQRTQQLAAIIRSTHPDVVGLVEATNVHVTQRPFVVEQLARELDMQLILVSDWLDDSSYTSQFQPALLTRLPIVYKKVHIHPDVLARPLLEVCVEESDGQQLIIFVTHLSAAFNEGWAGSAVRKRELKMILQIMAQVEGRPHLLIGDFNSLAPGDSFEASHLLRYVTQLDEKRQQLHVSDGHPYLDSIVPYQLRFFNPLLRAIARNSFLSRTLDTVASLYAPRGTISMMNRAAYIDCYRRIHPHAQGFTCPSAAPAGRIDFIFAHPMLGKRLENCDVVLEGEHVAGSLASDHLAIFASFNKQE